RIAYTVGEHKAAPLEAGRGGRRDKVVEGTVTWHMASLKVKPGDVIRFRAEALDYYNISGPHVGRSPELQIRIADRGELEAQHAQKQKEILEALKQLIKSQKETRAAVEAQRNAAKPDAARIGDTEQQQRALASQAGDIARQIAELTRSAQMNNLANPDETQLQQAAHQAMTDIANTAMPRAANQIATAQSNAKVNPQQSKQDLGSASTQQADILRRLA